MSSARRKPIHTVHVRHHAAVRAKQRLGLAGNIDKVKDVLRLMLAKALLYGYDYVPNKYAGRHRRTQGCLYEGLVYIFNREYMPGNIPIHSLITVYPVFEETQPND